jgi:surface polysaccharide O-acyltransferase-like enzyme
LYVDLLRIASVFGVIVIHTGASGWYNTPSYSWNWQIMNMWHDIFRWPVPLFVMISGMFNIEHYDIAQPLKNGIRKISMKILHIFCALVFWTVFYNIFMPIISNYNIKEFLVNPLAFLNFKEIIKYLYSAISGKAWYHLWFLYMIIGLYLLTPLAKIFVVNCKKNYFEYLLIVIFIIGTCIPFYNFVNSLKGIPGLPHKIHILIPKMSVYMGYYLAGYYFSKYKLPKKMEYGIYILGILSTAFTILGTSFISIKTNNLNQTLLLPITPNIMIETIAIFIFFRNIFQNVNVSETVRKIIENISKCSFGIYLIHDFMINIVNRYFGISWNTYNPIVSVPIICILVFLLSYIISFGISKIPIKKYIV